MAYAGPLCLLQTYKMMKCDSDFNLLMYNNELLDASSKTNDVNNFFDAKLTKLKTAQTRAYNINANTANGNPDEVARGIVTDMNAAGVELSASNLDDLLEEVNKKIDEVTEEQNTALAEIAADEQVWKTKVDNEQYHNQLLQNNIESFQNMVENNIASAHTYGYNS